MDTGKKMDPADKLANSLSSFIELKKTGLSTNIRPSGDESSLKYLTMFANLDRMWSKLPDEVVEDLNMKVLQMTHAELKQYSEVIVMHS